jgi:2-polyprenyl-3-methyl-5-hydroxy-6-metoxy-1,4-benzoquinol methylase
MKQILLGIKRLFYKMGLDIRFVRKEEVRSAIEMNEVETMNMYWSTKELSDRFLSRDVLKRFRDTLAILKNHQVDLAGQSVIDVGCGNGMLLKFLSENFKLSAQAGMEYAEAALEVARKLHPDPEYIVHDINMPCSKRYDAVICTEVIEHILHPKKAFRNLLDMVEDRGILFITVPNGRHDTFAGHINFWSPESWEVFIHENSGGLKYWTGRVEKILLYAIIYK